MESPTKSPSISNRKPLQGRSRERVNKVLAVAETLLLEVGPEGLSIPDVARQSGVPRASIYQFFPNKYALLLAIADIHLGRVAALIGTIEHQLRGASLEALGTITTRAAADYYNHHPVASMLILGGPMSRNAYLAQEFTIQDIGRRLRALLARDRPQLVVPDDPDVMTIAVEIAFACMKHSYFTHASITDAMAEQAAQAAVAYLRLWLPETAYD
ncbi:TetR/AcrR family transcriptional regulator [Marinobacter caseinilyticus]|uniref:TetR/AcrR family transcriptional regulator n=1 Tax=Marinobacter caseinilyticus TaxID=2692195 RepID=UPI001A94200D|nr:TetR/AcrR family transcriptional regulator [Marinobacter caseinilyticus]